MFDAGQAPIARRTLQVRALLAAGLCLLGLPPGPARAEPSPEVGGSGPQEDRRAIVQVLHDYLRVTDEQDQAAIAAAFHPAALLMSVSGDGRLNAMTQEAWWARISRPRNQPISRTSTIRYIDVAGVSAIARVDVVGTASISTDYFTLLRLQEGWRIVNKTLSTPLG